MIGRRLKCGFVHNVADEGECCWVREMLWFYRNFWVYDTLGSDIGGKTVSWYSGGG